MARYKYQGTFKDGSGAVIGAATTANSTDGVIYVYLAGTTTAASVYAAAAGGTAVNSVETDDYGHFYFYVDTDDYASTQQFKITLSHAEVENKTYDNIVIFGVDQELKSGAAPTFVGTNFTGIPYSGILAADRTGSDTDVVTGTKGTNGQIAMWNGDGDLVTAGVTKSGADATVITGTAGDASDFAMFNADGDIVGSGIAQSELDYTEISGNDGNTDVTGAELEELTDGSTTTLHDHQGVNWTYTAQVATATGTAVTVATSLPSDMTTVEILFNGVSTNTADTSPIIRLGYGGTPTYLATGDTCYASHANAAGAGGQGDTNGFYLGYEAGIDAANVCYGVMRLTRWDTSEHLWLMTSIIESSAQGVNIAAGQITVAEALNSIQLTTSAGTATFDAGEIRCRYTTD